jgi:hypothetical protein
MRKLGQGQSVMFFAPPEVHNQILSIVDKSSGDRVDTTDVVRWSIAGTCTTTRDSVPLWANQGLCYQKSQGAWLDYLDCGEVDQSDFAEEEAQTLEKMYGFEARADPLSNQNLCDSGRENEILAIQEKCKEFGVKSLRAIRQQEEQEREVSHEVEREQQVERPPPAKAHQHTIDGELLEFVRTGSIRSPSGFLEAFKTLHTYTSAKCSWVDGWSKHLLVTRDFAHTVQSTSNLDSYLRPVNWVLSSPENLLVISPFEANTIISLFQSPDPANIESSKHVGLHVYAPKVTKTMKAFEGFSFLSLPYASPAKTSHLLLLELNLFAGQLYLEDYLSYRDICRFLALYADVSIPEDVNINGDGFVPIEYRNRLVMGPSPFTKSPVALLRGLIGFRRMGQDYEPTHMGKILHAQLLDQAEFS